MFRGFGLCYYFAFVYFVLLQMPLSVRDLSDIHYLLSSIPTTAEREKDRQRETETETESETDKERQR